MAFTLASHILLVPLGVAMPTLTLLMEAIGIWRKDPIALKIARRSSVVIVDTRAALFTPALGSEFWHFLVAIYMPAGFVIASVYAVAWLRGRRDHYQRLASAIPFTVAAALTPVQLVVGDLSARALVQDQPAKFAAIELTWKTRDHNPEVIGGVRRPQRALRLGISIPSFDSFLAGYPP